MSYMIFRKSDCQLMLNINSFYAMLRFFGMSHSKAAATAGLFAHCVFRVFGARRNDAPQHNRRRTNERTDERFGEWRERGNNIICRCERAVYRGSRAIALKISPSFVNIFWLILNFIRSKNAV
uniref:Uncharacterized protein n=1 Tax=Trichogramma kaykai TaxID=54128 RepID=A0ABD2WY85_9HYME